MTRRGPLLRRISQSAVTWASLVTVVRGLGFLLVMAYALRSLSPNDIGLWYAMLGIVNVSLMAELGFNTTIGRFVSFYLGGAVHVPALGLRGTESSGGPNMRAIAGLIRMARRLYRILGTLTVGLTAGLGLGWLLFHGQTADLHTTHLLVFGILAIGSGMNMTVLFWLGMLFGMNKVRLHSQLVVVGLLVSYAVTFLCLRVGLGLYALGVGQILINLVPRLISRRCVLVAVPATAFEAAHTISWRAVWPMTWRAGLLLVGCYLCLQIMTLICSFVCDLETTASFGLTLQLALMLHLFAATWLATRLPQISALRSQGNHQAVREIMIRRIPLSMATYVAGAAFLMVAGPIILKMVGSNTPLLPPIEMGALLLVVGLNLFVGHHSSVLQTGNEVPHLHMYVTSGVLTLLLGFAFGRWLGVRGIILAPFLVQLCGNYWYTPLTCWRRLSLSGTHEAD
ncbi:MAG: hypothetical protein HQ523_03780 [Lentisphaerae bacterium]|nr:hypothetical protein [Lentisphaerota bacterium]